MPAGCSVQDVVGALLDLIDKSGGRLHGAQVLTSLAKLSPVFRAKVEAAGGPKKFCAAHREVEFITVESSDGFVQRRPTSRQEVIVALLDLISSAGGKLSGAQAVTKLSKLDPAFKGIIDAAGGLRKFCAAQPEVEFITDKGDGHVQRHAQKASEQDVVDALLQSIDRAGGKVNGGQAVTNLGKVTDALRVSDIYWSQDCVKVSFRNGTYLIDLLQELLDEPSRMQGLPLLDVAEHDGRWYAISGNRRLWVLKEYARLNDPMLSIPVRIRNLDVNRWAKLFKMRYSTESRGAHVGVVFQHRLKYQHFCTMTLALEAKLCRDIVAAESRQEGDTDSDESSSLESSSTASSRHRSADSGSLGLSALRRRVSVAAKLQARPDQNTSDTMRRTAEVGQLP